MGLSELGRFSEPALLVLISLADGPKHGYAMQHDIAELTGGRPGPGTLYGAVRRLEELGLITPHETDDARRRPYELTSLGRRQLQAELERLRTVAHTGLRRLATA
ncbi:PadR family transcriptional regulator [Streptosporangium vulgare]|uniref:PadR family transcriptional regulator n=2 Tax=Streptosporangium TaxID=2000 RepID=A0ABV5TUE7_9ACTN